MKGNREIPQEVEKIGKKIKCDDLYYMGLADGEEVYKAVFYVGMTEDGVVNATGYPIIIVGKNKQYKTVYGPEVFEYYDLLDNK